MLTLRESNIYDLASCFLAAIFRLAASMRVFIAHNVTGDSLRLQYSVRFNCADINPVSWLRDARCVLRNHHSRFRTRKKIYYFRSTEDPENILFT